MTYRSLLFLFLCRLRLRLQPPLRLQAGDLPRHDPHFTWSRHPHTHNRDLSQVFTSGTFRYPSLLRVRRRSGGMIDFKGSQFEREIILWGVRW